jgi:hypothetical protein
MKFMSSVEAKANSSEFEKQYCAVLRHRIIKYVLQRIQFISELFNDKSQ